MKGFTKILSKDNFTVQVVAYRDTIHPRFINEFKVKIDNRHCGQDVKVVRLSLARTVVAGSSSIDQIKVSDEEVAADTHHGGPGKQVIEFNMTLETPLEVHEKHPFNTNDGKT